MIVEMARRRRPGISQWVAASKLYNNVRDIQYGTARVIKQVGDEWLVTYLTASGDPRDVFVGGHEDRDGSVSLHVRLARRE
tara:strand:+ start:253 stop:495 length:243 start_codon:yes stop_codon:yes gene_type:complete